MRVVCLVLAAATLAVSPAVLAAEPHNKAAAPQNKREAIDPAYQLSMTVLPRATWDAITTAMTQTVLSAMKTPGEDFALTDSEFAEILNQLISYQEMLDLNAGLIKKYYSAEEITQLAAFFASPLGQKYIATTPQVMADSQGIVQAVIAEKAPAIDMLIKKRLNEKAAIKKTEKVRSTPTK
jgi:hypothetical protein